ncbi:MAG: RNA methyltransferase [Thermodesulfobacteriota bacterium]|nr:RNA methyltransferase [Thermodesulfobacteriota bacterium]
MEKAKMENLAIVLNRPKHPGNIGAVARCAKNMGISSIIVVNPLNADRKKIEQLATHFALDIVEKIKYFDRLDIALAPFNHIVGTTVRSGNTNLKRSMIYPGKMAEDIADISQNNRVALLFGPEDRGLTNSELKYCDVLVKIPSSEDLKSINLSHAVMIICYEIFTADSESASVFTPKLATSVEMEAMYDHLREMFVRIGFIKTQNPDYWMTNVRRLFSRTKLLARDVKIIRGICHQVDLYGKGKTGYLKDNV